MTISLIISTYNSVNFLNLCLKSVSELKFMPDEIIIADDGSEEETKLLIDSYREKIPVTIKHVWHEDKGFRLAEIRNKAINASECDYIISIDGDLLLNPYFVLDHKKMSKPRTFLQGTRASLTRDFTDRIIQNNYLKIRKLSSKDFSGRFKVIRALFIAPLINLMFEHRYPKRYAKGANTSFHKKDCLDINGFDNDFVGWGHEDVDFNLRMMNNEVKRRFLKHCAIAYHLYHDEKQRVNESPNKYKIEKHIEDNTIRCENGISNLL